MGDLVDFVKARMSSEDFKEFEQRLDIASSEAYNAAYNEGYDDGYQDGFDDGLGSTE